MKKKDIPLSESDKQNLVLILMCYDKSESYAKQYVRSIINPLEAAPCHS